MLHKIFFLYMESSSGPEEKHFMLHKIFFIFMGSKITEGMEAWMGTVKFLSVLWSSFE